MEWVCQVHPMKPDIKPFLKSGLCLTEKTMLLHSKII